MKLLKVNKKKQIRNVKYKDGGGLDKILNRWTNHFEKYLGMEQTSEHLQFKPMLR